MIQRLKKLIDARELLGLLMLRDIRVRYKQSALGVLWAVLQPLSLMLIFTLVFSRFAKIKTDVPYPIFAYCALLPWTFFASSLTFSIPSLVNNSNLVTKTYFPREVMPMAAIGACLVDFLIASVILVGLMLFYRVPLHATLLLVPVVLGVQIILTIAIALVGSAMNVFYRDIRYAVPLALQLWMFASPVAYPIETARSALPSWLLPWYYLNPMAAIINAYRELALYGRLPEAMPLLCSAAFAAGVAALAYAMFKRLEMRFADVI